MATKRKKKAKPKAQKPAMAVKMIGYKCEKLFMNDPKIESKFLHIYNQIA